MRDGVPRRYVRCSLCDEWYDRNGDCAKMHLHSEPQSGAPRLLKPLRVASGTGRVN